MEIEKLGDAEFLNVNNNIKCQHMRLIYLLNFALYFFDTNFITQTFKYKDKLVVIYLILIKQIKRF